MSKHEFAGEFRRQDRLRRLRQHRPGGPAADPAARRHIGGSHHHRHRRGQRAAAKPSITASRFVKAALTRENLPADARAAARRRRFPAESFGGRVEHRADPTCAASAARCIWIPASNRGPAATSTGACPVAARTNYAMRLEALALRGAPAPTAVLTHGANPGLVSHLVKQALLNIAADTGVDAGTPRSREEWAGLAQMLGIKVIHIAERDYAGGERAEKARRIRQHLVGGRIRERGRPAGRTRLGHPRAPFSRRRRTPRARVRGARSI